MASPASTDADFAAENFPEKCIHSSSTSSSEVEDGSDHSSAPPSPEIGMARGDRNDISGANLSLDYDDDDVDPELSATPSKSVGKLDDDALSTNESEDQRVQQPRVRQIQQPPPGSARRANPEPDPAYPPTRRSARAKSTLVYDQKYHPMDDAIRPSQATKRRLLHGEKPVGPNDLDTSSSEGSGSGAGSIVGDEDYDEEDSQLPARGRKRKRSRSRTPEPTRRSSRRRTKQKVSYNMKIHPQDSDLRRIDACDGSKSSPSPNKREGSVTVAFSREKESIKDFEEVGDARDNFLTSLSPEPSTTPQPAIAAESPPKPHRNFGDECPNLTPDLAYLAGNQGIWPDVKGLPFHIFTNLMEDQLHAEAEAASPLHYEDDDKENDVTNPELLPIPDPLDGISIIPASRYRRQPRLYALPNHIPMASNAFYVQPLFEASPYGLGWSDGARELNSSDARDCPVPEYMRMILSSEDMPRSPLHTDTGTRSDENDTVVSSSPVRNIRQLELRR